MLAAITVLVCLLILVAGLVRAGAERLGRLRKAPERRSALWAMAAVAVLSVCGLEIRAERPAHHVMYVDEPWYEEAATSLLDHGSPSICEETLRGERCSAYPKSIGWPTVLAVAFALFGRSEGVAFGACLSLATVAIGLAAALAWIVTRRSALAVAAALVATTLPIHVEWSRTVETNVPATTFVLASLVSIACWCERRRAAYLVAGCAGLVVAVAIRPETIVIVGVLLAVALAQPWRLALRDGSVVVVLGAACLWMIAPMWEINREISNGPFLSLANVGVGLAELARPPSVASYVAWTAVLSSLGAAGLVSSKRASVAIVLFAGAAGTAAVAFLYDRFMDRLLIVPMAMSIVPVCSIALLVERVISRTSARRWSVSGAAAFGLLLASGLAVAGSVATTPGERTPASQILEALLPERAGALIAADTPFVGEQPTVISATTGRRGMRTAEALRDPDALLRRAPRPIFVCDMYCEPGYGGMDNACPRFVSSFDLEWIEHRDLHGRRYGFLRILGERSPAWQDPHCGRSDER